MSAAAAAAEPMTDGEGAAGTPATAESHRLPNGRLWPKGTKPVFLKAQLAPQSEQTPISLARGPLAVTELPDAPRETGRGEAACVLSTTASNTATKLSAANLEAYAAA